MPSDDTTPNASRREQRSRRRRIWRRSLIVGLAVVLLAAGTAYALTGPLQHDDQGGGRASRSIPTNAPVAGTAAAQKCRAPLNPDDPLRLWIGGDSLAGSLGPSLGDQTAKTGVVLPTFDSRPSSGLASPSFFDWPKHALEEMQRVHP